jgi:hypothetical protein
MNSDMNPGQPRPRRTARILLGIVVIIALLAGGWLLAGTARVDGLARDYFVAHQGGLTVANVTIDATSLSTPPFWSVQISGDIIAPGPSSVPYRDHMWLRVEPISGTVTLAGPG